MGSPIGHGDLVSIVEAAYAIDAPEPVWLHQIVAAIAPRITQGLGAMGYVYDLRAGRVDVTTVADLDSVVPPNVLVAAVGSTTPDYIEESWKRLRCATASEVPGYDEQPAVKNYFEPLGVQDMFAVNAFDPSGIGVWIGAPLARRHRVADDERASWSRIAAHVATAFRLRRRVKAVEAIVSPRGETVHAEGEATRIAARKKLRAAALAIEHSRGALRKKDASEAVVNWRALVSGRWSLVDQFESDGRRYLVARTNDPKPSGPEVLTARERQVLAYAVLGHENKLIAYELGISASTVRVLLSRAARKLDVTTRAQLVAAFKKGCHPQ